ncbi:hypothetical protein ABPG72_017222 [Tetrahymena utriculariae]
MSRQEFQDNNQTINSQKNNSDKIKSLKKNTLSIEKLLYDLQDAQLYQDQLAKEQEIFKLIKRRMLQTNLSDKRAIGGLLGTAILGVIGLAAGLNILGVVIGGILGAFLGSYAGKRIKENALRKKKLMNIDLHVIKFAAYVSYLMDLQSQLQDSVELRMVLILLMSDCKMLILYSQKFQKLEKRQTIKIQKKLLKLLKNDKFMLACLEMYWMVKQWIKDSQKYTQLPIEVQEQVEKEIARISFNFLRPLSKLMGINMKSLNKKQKKLEQKINMLLMTAPILNLRESFAQQQHFQEGIEQEFLENIYKEVELQQLKEILEDQIAQDILKEDQIEIQNQQKSELKKSSLSHSKNQAYQDESKSQDALENRDPSYNNKSSSQNQQSNIQSISNNNSQIQPNPNHFHTNNNKQRLIDLINIASQQKQQEEDFTSFNSKIALEHFQSQFGRQKYLQNDKPKVLLFEKMAGDKQNEQIESQAEGNQVLEDKKQNNTLLVTNFKHSDDVLYDEEKSDNQNGTRHNKKNLELLDLQYQQFLKDQSANKKVNDGYIPQKFLSNNGIDGNQFASIVLSSTEIQQQIYQQEQNQKSNSKKSFSNFVLSINDYNQKKLDQEMGEKYSSKIEPKQESQVNDPANYLSQEEDNNKQFKKTVQAVYQKKYYPSRNCQLTSKTGRTSNINLSMNKEDLQAAIQELKFDNQRLNQNRDIRIKHIIHENFHQVENSPSQSFVRNKRGDVFLKMNSFDSISTHQNHIKDSFADNNNNKQENQQVVIDINQINQLQNDETVTKDHTKETDNQHNEKDIFLHIEHVPKSSFYSNAGELRNSQKIFLGNELHQNNEDQQLLKTPSQRQSLSHTKNLQAIHKENHGQNQALHLDQNQLQQFESNKQEFASSKGANINLQKVFTFEKEEGHQIGAMHLDIENSGFYAKDDQEQVDRVVISMLTSTSQAKRNSSQKAQKVDEEIEEKLIKLKILDDEDPEKYWEKVINKDKISIYKKSIPNNPSVMVRAEAFVSECSQEEVFEQIYYEKNRKKWDKVTLGFSVIEQLGEFEDIIYFYIDPGFGVTKRDFLQKRAVRRDYPEKDEITIVFFSTTHPSMPEIKGNIRAISNIAAYIIRPVKEGKKHCHLTIITQSDIKGQIPKYIVNFLAARAPAKWIESMKKGVLDYRKQIKK